MIHINKTNIRIININKIDINKNSMNKIDTNKIAIKKKNTFHLLHTYLEASCSPPSDRDVRIESISSRNMVEGA